MTTNREATWNVSSDIALPLDQPRLMGILNVTPDSFSDGGRYATASDGVNAAKRMKDEGACIIDIGGESTRPGASAVHEAEQIRRTIPVIQEIRKCFSSEELLLSIDTTRSEVARAALDAGANIINDISAGRDDDAMLPLAASRKCGIILMHRRSAPDKDVYSDQYAIAPDYGGDVVLHVRQFLQQRCEAAIAAGIDPAAIVLDPGVGFGKTVEQNFELIHRTRELIKLNHPLLSAVSRKSFIGAVSNEPNPVGRVFGTIAITVVQWLAGVRLFRVHDVAAHRQALDVLVRCATR